ncbi:GTP 3',8-cyclase MoaA [Propionibacterium australiense]|uniref:GTP 3',8-cyclase n=1 Tax=Propionibacterium australiense TaxID=119981 RepID=A0A383S7I5_9ACTN|nr:GTP 3',8-cyclase MoaA [Propionibacterium australiense]RLP07614.1 GTP 3',8-cyclase MoaA [Propionibacterium australiense]RLP08376.1 GTP 3',8-cyclase MoaA [Propionibacterium australiense]SYZ33970.1 cyclic pyranopterin phosphate synthase [Propionibacterium australiense]VEH88947.1 Probable molybdopterin cofactor synthesis protein A [Propionibacterium australiense]
MNAQQHGAAAGPLVDRFGRVARDLRVSLTDRCTLRCSYCMPPEGLDWLPTEQTLTGEEVVRLCRIGVERLGIRTIRFTGGEPLLRRGLESIIAAAAELRTDQGPAPELALTTNGLGLEHRAQALAEAGLSRVNVSLDTLDAEHYARITHRDRLPDVLAGLAAAQRAGLRPVKVNAVLLRGVNDTDAPALLDFCLDAGVQLRFIEQMPIGPLDAWRRDRLVTGEDILALLGATHRLSPAPAQDPHAPARLWQVDGDPTRTVGIIASVSAPFCEACDRTRLTADGQLRSCLFSTSETDLRGPLRAGADDAMIARAWRDAMWAKPAAHGLNNSEFAAPSRTMSRIGG